MKLSSVRVSRNQAHLPKRRMSAIALAAAAALGPLAVTPAEAATCTWNTTSGNWAAIGNWLACATGNGNPAASPGAADTANIGASGVVTVDNAQRIGTLNNAGSLVIESSLRATGGLNGGGTTTIQNGALLNLEDTQTVGGNATIVFGAGNNNRVGVDGGNKTVTFDTGTTVRGLTGSIGLGQLISGSGNSVLNKGLISSDSGGTITVAQSSLSNEGIAEATGAGSALVLQSNVDNSGGLLRATAGGVVRQEGVTVSGGTISTSGGGSYRASGSGSNVLAGVMLSSGSLIDMASAFSTLRVSGGMTLNGNVNVNTASLLNFEGNQTLSGTGNIVFGGTAGNNRVGVDGGNKTLTIGSGISIHGENGVIGVGQLISGSGNAIVNNGTIRADVAGGTVTIAGLSAGITNNGTIGAANGGTLALQSNLTGGAGSQLVAGAGSVIAQQAVTISGIVNTSGSGNLRPTGSGSNYLSGVSFTGTLDMASAFATERVINGLVLNGTVNVNNSSLINFEGNQSLSGTGNIVFGATASNNRVGVDGGNKTLTIGSGITIRGENGIVGVGQLVSGSGNAIVNNGTIRADVAGGTVTIAGLGAGITNNGTIGATNGATLQLQSNLLGTPTGQLVAGPGSLILQQGVTIAGIVNTSGGGSLRPSGSGSNYLSGVTLNGNLDMAGAMATERVIGNLVLNGVVDIDSASYLNFEGDQTLSGSGSIVFGSTAGNNRVGVDGGNKTLTVASGITIRGQTGTIGVGQLVSGSGNTLVNQGVISSDGGGTINVAQSTLVNQNIAQAVGAGSVLRLDSAVNNTGGTLRSSAGGVVLQNGVTVTGGNITNATGGRYQLTASGSNFLSGVTLTGGSVIDMASATATGRVINGMTLNGTLNLASSSLLNMEGTQTLGGNGTIVFGSDANNRIGVDGGNKILTIASGVTIRGQNGIVGPGQLVSGSGNSIVNKGTISADGGGTISIQGLTAGIQNDGLLRAQTGTLNVATALTGSGTLRVDAAGAMNLAAGAKTQGTLTMGAAGAALNLAAGNLTLNNDYTNVGAGVGNAFNRRAGITGSGEIVAGGDAAQAITGINVSNGDTANATMTIGNVRVGASNFAYQVANTGSTGPTLRGAIQTTVNGANLSDARLSGSGVTASNYSTGAPGSDSGNLGVVFTAASAGALAPLSGQVLNLRSNFSNIADQKLNITLGSGAAAYNVAVGSTSPSPVQVANQRVGGTGTAALTVSNTAASGAFSEALNATFSGATGTATQNGGSVSNLIAGGSNATAMRVGVDTTSAGAKSGNITIAYQSDGTGPNGNSGLAAISAGNQVIAVSGDVYRLASPSITSGAITLAARVGDAAPSASIGVTNTSPDIYTERLNGSIASTPSGFNGSGSITGLVAGASSNALGVSLNTATAGNYSGQASVGFVSSGAGTTGAANQALASQNVSVSGTVYTPAVAQLNTSTVNFGIVHVGDSVAARNVSVTNAAAVAAPNDVLTGNLGGASGPFNASGALAGVAAQQTNANSLVVNLSTANAGVFNGSAAASFASHNSEMSDLDLASQVVTLQAQVNNFAELALGKTAGAGSLTLTGSTYTLNFGNLLQGSAALDASLAIFNVATGPADVLGGSFAIGAGSGFVLSGFGPFSGLGAGDSQGASMVSFASANLGTFTQTIVISALGSNASGYQGALADTTLVLQGSVVAVPEPATYALMAGGLLAVWLARRRRVVAGKL